MGRDESSPVLPPRVKAAFDFLHHARMVTEQVDASVPMRPLTALEKSVEAAALQVVQTRSSFLRSHTTSAKWRSTCRK